MTQPVQARSLKMIERILDATETLVAREGIGSLTMDAVSAEAGVSKGAVQHHFRSKDAIVEALAARKLRSLRADLERELSLLPAGGPRALPGMARHARSEYDDERAFPRALLLAVVENSNAHDLFRAMFADTLKDVKAESRGRKLDTVLVFAVMGLLLTKSLGLSDLATDEAHGLFDEIVRQAYRSPADDG